MSNPNATACGDTVCFRPTGLVLDDQERIFMTSDATGEIWVIRRTSGSAGSGTGTGIETGGGTEAPSGTAGGASSTPTSAASKIGGAVTAWVVLALALWAFV